MTVTVSRIGDFVWKLEGTGKGLSMEAELSRELLKDGRRKVYEVAQAVGYREIGYFSATFKKITGLTPSEYQERQF